MNQTNRPNQPNAFNLSGLTKWIVAFIVGIILISILTSSTFLTIEPGHKGVLFKRFGGGLDMETTYNQGFHLVMPWNKMFVYDVRIHEDNESMEVLSRNGLNIKLDLSFLYQPKSGKVASLHNEVGIDYAERVLKPSLRSATREVIGKYLPEELYSSRRETIQTEIYELTLKNVDPKHIYLDAVLIREVKLPPTLEQAIERKLKEEQSALEYEFRLERERKEAERVIIEAQAQADANRLLSSSIDQNILRNKGIEATLQLAESQNSKIVVIGSGEDGLPLILGSQE
ncbi:prohibitin family protein [Membranihabitans maritimus]|uniref:prohibitin family protein n=1 Tax=Membranihabitans maritimus TaxID=2904244 RepID=UPI001F4474E2|nr:prohibitin family protein [Membranihabitans maritimus]